MKLESEVRIEKMRNGEKIKCTRCEEGYFSAVGDPKTTNVFRCNSCKTGMVLTLTHRWDSDGKLVFPTQNGKK